MLRALTPSHGIEDGLISASAMADYVNRVWTKYSTSTLTVTNFTNSAGAVVTSFQKPDSASIFGCDGLLDARNDLVRGPISRTLCAGYNRSTLLTDANQPDTNAADFYTDTVTNQYARKIHEQMTDGKAYAFPFDDVGNFESLVQNANPQGAFLTLEPLS